MKLVHIVLIIALSAGTAFAVGKYVAPSNETAAKTETAFERVMRTGVLRCGYVVYQPAVIKDAAGQKLSGFAYDIVKRMGENLGWKVEWVEEVTPGTMIEGLKSHRYDMVCTPFWPDADRIKGADFSLGFYYSGMGAWVRTDDHRFDTEDAQTINQPDVTLSVMDGTTLVAVARQDFPQAKTFTVPQGAPLTDLVLNVTTNKADVVVLDNYLARDYEAANKGSIRLALGGKNVRTYPNAFVLPADEPRFKTAIDVALTELMNSGFADERITHYEKYPGTFLRAAKPYTPSIEQP